jgi:hypothetical protein
MQSEELDQYNVYFNRELNKLTPWKRNTFHVEWIETLESTLWNLGFILFIWIGNDFFEAIYAPDLPGTLPKGYSGSLEALNNMPAELHNRGDFKTQMREQLIAERAERAYQASRAK